MHIHLVGGFLGSGKTTAIIHAAKGLVARGKRVGVVTNDKGKHLVDSAFFRSADLPTAEVAGGCFRCNFDELEKQIRLLEENARPDVIFAESVGSCADMAATVLEPLLTLQRANDHPTTFSVFVDVRLLRLWLLGEELPYSEEVRYIFEKQLEEAGLLVLNKIDLLSATELQEVEELARERYPDKILVMQNSLSEAGTAEWMHLLEAGQGTSVPEDAGMDYDRYDAGSRQLAWLDEEITLWGQDAVAAAETMISALVKSLQAAEIPVGHLKFFVAWEGGQCKISFATWAEEGWQAPLDGVAASELKLLVNGRVQTAPAHLNRMIVAALEEMAGRTEVSYQRAETAYFRPRIMQRRQESMPRMAIKIDHEGRGDK